MEPKEALLQALRALKSSVPELRVGLRANWFLPHVGICCNVMDFLGNTGELDDDEDFDEADSLLQHTIEKWPDAHGEASCYPVGGIDEYENKENLWRNPRRIELLDWLIGEFENGH